ncbi:Mu transposase C-terminal domain-containing protein [Streptomyces nogalater]
MAGYGDLTPLQWWNSDPSPLREVSAEDLHAFLLEGDRSTRVINGHGIRFKDATTWRWMTGRSGTRVHIRFQPHHLDQIEIFDADNRRHLGTAYLADQATDEQIEQVYQARAERARRVRRDLRRAETLRRRRFKAHTSAGPAQADTTMTRKEAAKELRTWRSSRADDDLPTDYMPRRITPPGRWAVPGISTPPRKTRDHRAHHPDPFPGRTTRIIRGQEVRWRGRSYTAAWMTTHAQRTVCVRPRNPDTLDVYDPDTGQPLGTAHAQPPHPHSDNTHTAQTSSKESDVTDTTQTAPRTDQDEVVGEPDFYLNLARPHRRHRSPPRSQREHRRHHRSPGHVLHLRRRASAKPSRSWPL